MLLKRLNLNGSTALLRLSVDVLASLYEDRSTRGVASCSMLRSARLFKRWSGR